MIDVGKLCVTKTYHLEGNGELIVEAYAQVQEIAEATAMDNYPLTLTEATEFSDGNQAEVDRLMCRAKSATFAFALTTAMATYSVLYPSTRQCASFAHSKPGRYN